MRTLHQRKRDSCERTKSGLFLAWTREEEKCPSLLFFGEKFSPMTEPWEGEKSVRNALTTFTLLWSWALLRRFYSHTSIHIIPRKEGERERTFPLQSPHGRLAKESFLPLFPRKRAATYRLNHLSCERKKNRGNLRVSGSRAREHNQSAK